MGKLLGGQPAPSGLTLVTECPPFPQGGSEAIAQWLERNQDARMVVIDVFAKMRGQAPQGVSAYDADYVSVGYAKRLADHYGIAVVLVHHVRKMASEDFLTEVSGTNGIAGAADATLVLKRARGQADGILHVTGRDVSEAEYALVYLGAYGPLRPEEQAELRRKDVDLDAMTIRVRKAAPELNTGERAVGDTKSEAGNRYVVLPAFLHLDLRRHLDRYAEKGPEGLLFVGEQGAPFRRSSFGRKWRKARRTVGMPDSFRFYDLRHTGHTLATRSGATLKDTMVRAGQSSEKAALIYQHSDHERQKEVASGLDKMVRAARGKGSEQRKDGQGDAEVVRKWCATLRPVQTTKKPRADGLGLLYGAGDENRTRALSLGITGLCAPIGELTRGNRC
ncbi:tyrosine-type recombinase/integrase [Streptomyces sp. NBC_00154]|uniref:tyrosine-type recombinase/integrase n=1 Tax=Streptomyces sp. NBC_00154 TaxID=2975670 RepID=UPI0022583974|nr:tyrosine-type recombinase/integrase [Streptomyces sp. NBC_00154]MCX5311758.1 tyrosine-type recombinase/integrase [Streptomyces sp. NBC_00154]